MRSHYMTASVLRPTIDNQKDKLQIALSAALLGQVAVAALPRNDD